MVKFINIIIIVIIVDIQVNPTGGRITVVQGSLPNIGPGAVENREAGAGEKVWLSLCILLYTLIFMLVNSESDRDGEAAEPVNGLLQAARPRVQRAADRCRSLCHCQVGELAFQD